MATVTFSWEHEPGVSKQSPVAKPGPPAAAPEEAHAVPESPRKAPARRLLYVPPPPGGPAVPARRSTARAPGAVRPEDDPFLAAYLVCTKSGKKAKGQRLFGWAGPGLGLGRSCKSFNGVVEGSMVRVAKAPEVRPRDA